MLRQALSLRYASTWAAPGVLFRYSAARYIRSRSAGCPEAPRSIAQPTRLAPTLRFPRQITLAYRGGRRGGTAFNPFGYRLGGWPQRIKHKPRVVLAADVQVGVRCCVHPRGLPACASAAVRANVLHWLPSVAV